MAKVNVYYTYEVQGVETVEVPDKLVEDVKKYEDSKIFTFERDQWNKALDKLEMELDPVYRKIDYDHQEVQLWRLEDEDGEVIVEW